MPNPEHRPSSLTQPCQPTSNTRPAPASPPHCPRPQVQSCIVSPGLSPGSHWSIFQTWRKLLKTHPHAFLPSTSSLRLECKSQSPEMANKCAPRPSAPTSRLSLPCSFCFSYAGPLVPPQTSRQLPLQASPLPPNRSSLQASAQMLPPQRHHPHHSHLSLISLTFLTWLCLPGSCIFPYLLVLWTEFCVPHTP